MESAGDIPVVGRAGRFRERKAMWPECEDLGLPAHESRDGRTWPGPSRPVGAGSLAVPSDVNADNVGGVVQLQHARLAIKGEDEHSYYRRITAALQHLPNVLTMDDGADLVSAMIFIALDRLRRSSSGGPSLGVPSSVLRTARPWWPT